MTVCTHFLPAEIIAWMRAKEKIHCRQATVVTDFDVHAMWLCRGCEHYFVAHRRDPRPPGGARRPRRARSPSRASRSTRSSRARPTRRRCAASTGWSPTRTTILISAGGFGVGQVGVMLESLMKLRHPAQVIAICGRNAELKAEIEAQFGRRPPTRSVSVKVLGFTTVMDELMAASDLIVGKPGGLDDVRGPGPGPGLRGRQPDPRPGGAEQRPPPRGRGRDPLQQPARCSPTRSTSCWTTRAARRDARQRPSPRPPARGPRHRRRPLGERSVLPQVTRGSSSRPCRARRSGGNRGPGSGR